MNRDTPILVGLGDRNVPGYSLKLRNGDTPGWDLGVIEWISWTVGSKGGILKLRNRDTPGLDLGVCCSDFVDSGL